jgi:glycosyltransferase involved in cell wall biosynthesis
MFMRVMHVVAPSAVGGLERVVHTLAVAQQLGGDDVHVAAVLDAADAAAGFIDPLEHEAIRVHRVVPGHRHYLREQHDIAELCRSVRPDVVHTHGSRADVVDAAAARHAGCVTIATVHGFLGGTVRNRCYEWLQCRSLRSASAVAAVAAPIVERLVTTGVKRNRVRLLRNAWRASAEPLDRHTARDFLGITSDAFRIGWIGRVSREKGLDNLVRALPSLADLRVQVSILGDGPERGAVLREAKALGVGDQLSWHGVVPGADRVLAAFDVIILSSRSEGTPIVLLEAMAAGVPVVASAVGGVPDVVNNVEAHLVRAGDTRELAQAIRDVHDRPVAAAGRAAAARRRLDCNFGVAPWLDGYRDLYATAVAAPGAS